MALRHRTSPTTSGVSPTSARGVSPALGVNTRSRRSSIAAVHREVRRNHRGKFGGRSGEIIEGGSDFSIEYYLFNGHNNITRMITVTISRTHARTHPFNGPLSGSTQVSWYQKGKTNLDLTKATDSEWQWHQPGHM